MPQVANARTARTIRAWPVDRIDADRAAILPLPPIPPAVGWRKHIRLGPDNHVRRDAYDYPVDPPAIGRMVDVTAGPGPLDRRPVADHAQVWARRRTVTDPSHQA